MQRFFILTISLSLLLASCKQPKKAAPKQGFHTDIFIPSAWIDKVKNYDYKQNNAPLLKEFDSFLKPDSLFVPSFQENLDKTKAGILNPIFTDLDGDGNNELLCTIGWIEEHPSMAVFKKIGADWHLLYLEDYYMFYNSPDMYIANNYAKNKTFYFRRVYQRGSGVYADGYSFYKLINNKVYPCLELVNKAYIVGWGLYINQKVSMTLNFTEYEGDALWVKYDYLFFPGPINENDADWDSNEDLQLIKGENSVLYEWNNEKSIYKLDVKPNKNEYDVLNAEKIACFGAFGNDSLFVKAFDPEIKQTLQTGTAMQKKILKRYLDILKHDKIAATQKLEEKTQVGGTKFYGPK
jgi:hypothetical protein